jgi:hypothetical protein
LDETAWRESACPGREITAGSAEAQESMIPKSGYRFFGKDHAPPRI